MKHNKKQKAGTNLATLIFIVIVIYALFKIDIKDTINSPKFQKNVNYFKEIVQNTKDKLFSQEKLDKALNDILKNDFSLNNSSDNPMNLNIIPIIDQKDFGIPVNYDYNIQNNNQMRLIDTMNKNTNQSNQNQSLGQ